MVLCRAGQSRITARSEMNPQDSQLKSVAAVAQEADGFAKRLADQMRDDPSNRFQGMPSDGESREAYEALGRSGWIGLHWPETIGGGGLTAAHTDAAEERFGYHWLPLCSYLLGVKTIGNAILRFASAELTERILPEVIAGQTVFCQGFSEPGAGSDLAALRTRAVKRPGGYVVSGHKIWTSSAQMADWIYLAVRTDPDAIRPHRGLSVLVCRMDTPGIQVREFPTLGGGVLCEVWLDEVYVPEDQLVGDQDGGWQVLMGTLDYERVTSEKVGVVARVVDELEAVAERADHRSELRAVRGELDAARELGRAASRHLMRGVPASGVSSMCKLSVALLCRRIARLGMDVLGAEALIDGGVHDGVAGKVAALRRATVGATIAGGASEIQRRVIARRSLNLASR
jgi:alkylation response protein AidB-like acyl-CoA dehydrogenase